MEEVLSSVCVRAHTRVCTPMWTHTRVCAQVEGICREMDIRYGAASVASLCLSFFYSHIGKVEKWTFFSKVLKSIFLSVLQPPWAGESDLMEISDEGPIQPYSLLLPSPTNVAFDPAPMWT